ncbi:hypothetical protein K450DRAFT_262412 [Umbelopsis ramanniana AG]|uniref:Reverse transcriptase domain-containing protein n=1 Tax=Umbelopsis ramanniana AG TaxID=1314678 RepID=A0AAD5E1S0_UMBRA|nr:uncharacterized protein K450DRAFT_262412 [Umbelopsis ramanniana AG]KAI8575284.1 hypothetical protein K450DRAFT_262412 [Umbelopsis ramanniana AG]
MIVNQSVGPLLSRSVGLFQGSLLSPWLFNVYINDLAEKIARIDFHPFIPPLLLFSDDILLRTLHSFHRQTYAIHCPNLDCSQWYQCQCQCQQIGHY